MQVFIKNPRFMKVALKNIGNSKQDEGFFFYKIRMFSSNSSYGGSPLGIVPRVLITVGITMDFFFRKCFTLICKS